MWISSVSSSRRKRCGTWIMRFQQTWPPRATGLCLKRSCENAAAFLLKQAPGGVESLKVHVAEQRMTSSCPPS